MALPRRAWTSGIRLASCRRLLCIRQIHSRRPFSLLSSVPGSHLMESGSSLGKRPAEDVQESEKNKVPRADPETPASPGLAAPVQSVDPTEQRGAKTLGKAGKARPLERARRGTRTEPRPEGEEREPRLPKRQCALLIGFSGTGYPKWRSQRVVFLTTKSSQPTGKTIENTLFKALVEAGAVSQDNSDNPVKVGLHCTCTLPPALTHMQVNINRAARTDAGVHAAGNVVSMKLISVIPGVPDLVGRINELLPPDIRLWSVVREHLDDVHSTSL
jgi:tRNA pseudouridine38-40 synthase